MATSGESRERRALVAEDDDLLRSVVADALRAEGFEVDEVGDGAQMLDRAMPVTSGPGRAAEGYALLVSDVRMPLLDGIAVVDRLREQGVRTPVILMSAFGDEWARVKVTALDVVLMDKPFKVAELRAVARRLGGGGASIGVNGVTSGAGFAEAKR
jgi:DNA-binding response OmpR family regulator